MPKWRIRNTNHVPPLSVHVRTSAEYKINGNTINIQSNHHSKMNHFNFHPFETNFQYSRGSSTFIRNDRPVLVQKTIRFSPLGPFTFWLQERSFRGPSTLSLFGPSSLDHDRAISCLRTVRCNPPGPFTLTQDRPLWTRLILMLNIFTELLWVHSTLDLA